MFDRVGLIRALNPTLGLVFDRFCQACPRLAIYRKVRKTSLSARFSVERYIVRINSKPSSSASGPHHQAVPTTKPSSPPSSPHHQAVPTKSSPPSRPHYQAVLTTKPYYQATVASQPTKPPYQAILSSDRSKHTLGSCYGRLLRSLLSACYGLVEWLDKVTW
jgi:hypothetical protein